MKDFMFLFRNAGANVNASPEEMQATMQKWFGWINELKGKNIYKEGEPLTRAGKIVKGADALVTDGPFTESKEIIGGFFIISANSLEEAAELAKGSPDLPIGGSVEVREVMKM